MEINLALFCVFDSKPIPENPFVESERQKIYMDMAKICIEKNNNSEDVKTFIFSSLNSYKNPSDTKDQIFAELVKKAISQKQVEIAYFLLMKMPDDSPLKNALVDKYKELTSSV